MDINCKVDGFDSKGEGDTLVLGGRRSCIVRQVGGSKTGFYSKVGSEVRGGDSCIRVERNCKVDVVDSKGEGDTLVLGG